VLRMLLHREATVVLSDAFELYANAYERTILLQDFYGKEASLFSVTKGTEQEKERAKKGLPGVLEGADKERSKRVLASVKQALVTMYSIRPTHHSVYLLLSLDSITLTKAPLATLLFIGFYGNT